MFRRYLAWRGRNKQRPQIWDKSPTDWRYFGRSLLVSVLIGLIAGVVLGWIPYLAGIVLLFGWLPTVIARHELDRARRQAGIPFRPFPGWLIAAGVVVTIALLGFGRMAIDSKPFGSTDNFTNATGSIIGSLIFAGLLAARWSGKTLESPRNRAMLDAEWQREQWQREQWHRAQMAQLTNSWTHPPA